MIPSLIWNHEFPRRMAGEFEPPLSLLQMLVFPLPIIPFELQHDQFERYYVLGPVLFIMLLVGLRRRIFARPELRPLVVLAALAFLTAVGSLEPFALPRVMPFDLLRRIVPGYQAMRVPSRFFINAIPAILIVAGLAWQRALDTRDWGIARRRWLLYGALVPLVLFNFGYFNFSLFDQERGVDRPQPAEEASDFRWGPTGYTFQMMRILEPNVGVLDCYEALEFPKAEGLIAQHDLLLDADAPVEVDRLNWGEIAVRTPTPAHVRFNFNHHRDWHVVDSDGEAAIVSENGMPLGLSISEGTVARIQYQSPAWALSAKITLAAFALALLFAAVCIARRRTT
jgi:hypothetical protein